VGWGRVAREREKGALSVVKFWWVTGISRSSCRFAPAYHISSSLRLVPLSRSSPSPLHGVGRVNRAREPRLPQHVRESPDDESADYRAHESVGYDWGYVGEEVLAPEGVAGLKYYGGEEDKEKHLGIEGEEGERIAGGGELRGVGGWRGAKDGRSEVTREGASNK